MRMYQADSTFWSVLVRQGGIFDPRNRYYARYRTVILRIHQLRHKCIWYSSVPNVSINFLSLPFLSVHGSPTILTVINSNIPSGLNVKCIRHMIELISYWGDLFCAFLFMRNKIVWALPPGGGPHSVHHVKCIRHMIELISY